MFVLDDISRVNNLVRFILEKESNIFTNLHASEGREQQLVNTNIMKR